MDSAPSTSESPAAEFGVRLARRVRSRSRVTRQLVGRPLTGAIARSALGFSRAIGRAGAVRPVVTPDVLNSALLRPPVMWRRLAADDDPTAQVSASDTWPFGSDVEARAPTWTDRLLDPRPATPVRPGTRRGDVDDSDFVELGDRKVDSLRRLLRSGPPDGDGADLTWAEAAHAQLPPWLREPPVPGDEPSTLSTMESRTHRGANANPDGLEATSNVPDRQVFTADDERARRSVRGDTVAGETTAPGRLGDRLRPEATDVDAAMTAYGRRRAAARSSTRGAPGLPSTPAVGRGGDAGPRGRGSRASKKVESLRRMLEASGKIPPSSDSSSGGQSTGAATGTSSMHAERRSPASDAPADRAGRPAPGPSGPDASGVGRSGSPSPASDTPADRAGRPAPPSLGPDASGGGRSGPPSLAIEESESGPPGAPGSRSQHTLPSRDDRARALRRATTEQPPDGSPAATPPHASLDAIGSLDPIGSLDRETRPPDVVRHGTRPPTPVLPGQPVAADTRLRRVTLPRAMSAVHRPAATFRSDAPVASTSPATAVFGASIGGPGRAVAPSGRPVTDRPGGLDSSTAVGQLSGSVSTMSTAFVDHPMDVHRPPRTLHATNLLLSVVRDGAADAATVLTTNLPAAHVRPAAVPGAAEVAVSVREVTDAANPLVASEPRPPALSSDRSGGPSQRDTPAADSASELSARFMTELSRSVRRTPAPLPIQYRPMAAVISGERRVRVSTDDSSRRALRAVGMRAATTGDVIHLDPTIAGPRRDEVMAHELTHVAHPSPEPRFFDDPDDSPEERRAEQVARIIARSPLAPSSSVAAVPSARRRGSGAPQTRDRRTDTIRRSPASPTNSTAGTRAAGTIDAASLAARIAGTAAATPPEIQRSRLPAVADRFGGTGTFAVGDDLRDTDRLPDRHGAPPSAERASVADQMSDREFLSLFERNMSRITRLLERRVLAELERRGGRYWRQL